MTEDKNKETRQHSAAAYYLFLSIIGVVFLLFTAVFLFFPRTSYSELEKRDLAEFPDINNYKDNISKYPSDISTWFSDSEPFRDNFMTLSMGIRDALGMNFGNPEEAISFKAPEAAETPDEVMEPEELLEAAGNPLANANAKMANSGIIVVGSGPTVRALMAYGGTPAMAAPYIKTITDYVNALPGVKIYALVAPLATEFYLPEKAAKLSRPQKPVIDYIRENLPDGAKMVDAYSYLAAHTNEDIYLRTDHHWAPLGGFYAAKALAKAAGVPFKELDSYNKNVLHGFVGSMYGYSKDIAVKNAPEDFVYYTPKGLDYKTTYITYKTNKDYKVTSASAPYQGQFFHKFSDGSSNAYLTFMGGDQHLVKVNTGTPSNRRLLIIKDSYGNTLPGYMFYSFGEVHVVDFRYFLPNLTKYIKDNGITDVVIALNTFNAVSGTNQNRISGLLRQNGQLASPTPEATTATQKKTDTPAHTNAHKESNAKESTPKETLQKNETPETPKKNESVAEPAPAPAQSPE